MIINQSVISNNSANKPSLCPCQFSFYMLQRVLAFLVRIDLDPSCQPKPLLEKNRSFNLRKLLSIALILNC